MLTERVALTAPERFDIMDNEGRLYHGCDQDWYGLPWQRMAGCGPSVATNVLYYLSRAGVIELPLEVHPNQHDTQRLMELVWRYVTPTMHGVNKTSIFSEGLLRFCAAHHARMECHSLNIPKQAEQRPNASDVVDFIARGLAHDRPVAFLNLNNGEVKNLDDWHWVTIIAMEQAGDGVHLTVYDNGVELDIDLALWVQTTTLGGGFVYLCPGGTAELVQEL